MKDYLTQAIRLLKPNSEFVFYDNDYSTIIWHTLDGEAPTQKEIDAAIVQVKADEIAEAQTKANQRQAILDRLGITAEEAQLILS
jgi:hypothetical protein